MNPPNAADVPNPNSMSASDAPLPRTLGPVQATALNVSNMIGAGPFITIPFFIAAMHGPHAMIAWVIAAILVLCDGMVWAELGAALPGSGGTYHFLRSIFGPYKIGGFPWGRMIPFLFIWQFLVSGALELASGYIAGVQFINYIFPELKATLIAWRVPYDLHSLAAVAALVVSASLCRPIRSLGAIGVVLAAAAILTVLTVIVVGLTHFNPSLLTIPRNAFTFSREFYIGLGAAMTIAVYDYLGYYNICHLGAEVREPARTIPRAVVGSVLIVATLYLTMNFAIMGVVPWQVAQSSPNIAAEVMLKVYGWPAADAFTVFLVITVFACLFAMTLGYSRIPYAAATQGDFFPIFTRLHPTHRYPYVSLAALGLLVAACCFLSLEDLIISAVTVRIGVQFIGQIIGLEVLRRLRADVPRPFRMPLYPLPSIVALAGWCFILAMSKWQHLALAGGVLVTGAFAFCLWRLWDSRLSRA